MNTKNEIILKIEVISLPKENVLFKVEPNLTKKHFFCVVKKWEKKIL